MVTQNEGVAFGDALYISLVSELNAFTMSKLLKYRDMLNEADIRMSYVPDLDNVENIADLFSVMGEAEQNMPASDTEEEDKNDEGEEIV